MQRLLTFCLLGAFGAALAGCHASATVDDPDTSKPGYKKETTTVRSPDGSVKTETEVKRTN